MISLLLTILGMYMIFYSLSVSVHRYDSQSAVPKADRFLYWGALPIFLSGAILFIIGLIK